MAATIITPSGTGAMEAGLVLDEEGSRFVVLTFKEPQGEPTLITFTVPVFPELRGASGSNSQCR
jgi:hypothetical protein